MTTVRFDTPLRTNAPEVMDIRDFGDALIRTGDLDPVYFIANAGIPEPQMCRLLLAYWMFYHLGASCWLSEQEGDNYWQNMLFAAENKVAPGAIQEGLPPGLWPRASERRHFRGSKCVHAVNWLKDNSTAPEHWVRGLTSAPTEAKVMAEVERWPMFGPWVAFKAADMLERVMGAPVKFDPNIGLMYESPAAGLERLAMDHNFMAVQHTPTALYHNLLTYFSPRLAPPRRDRGCGPQEVETILCKWDSHAKGGYWVGKDIKEVRHALAGWGETADRALRAMPQEVPQ